MWISRSSAVGEMNSRWKVIFFVSLCACCVLAQKLGGASTRTEAIGSPAATPAKDAGKMDSSNPPVNKVVAAKEFANAGKKEGLEVWRIENFSPVPVKTSEFGKFYKGDSYLVLKTKDAKGKLSWNVHYWIGSESSQDESGSAAILAVELDDSLGGAPVQHREVEGHESQLFQSYFPTRIVYLTGGVKSGFSHVTPNAGDGIKKLYQVKGKKDVRIRQIEPVVSAMNKGDCFILDSGEKIYVYHGPNSKRTERLKAISAANQIRDLDHSGRTPVQVLDEAAKDEEFEEFFKVLGSGTRKGVPEQAKGGDDEQFEKEFDSQVALYKVSDASGALKIEKVGQKPLSQTYLNTNDCFILDTVKSGIFSWIGKKATKAEKQEALRKGEEFLKAKNYPSWTRITRVIEGGEPSTFKQFFKEWRAGGDRAGMGRK